jgi:endoglucanase
MGQLTSLLTTRGTRIETEDGEGVHLKGVGLGGWMNMENFITGYPANEALMRSSVARVLGQERSAMFFDRLLHSFFGPADAELLASMGLNHVRLPINYRHFEDDERPFAIKEDGFRHLDRVIDLCADAGLYTIIDLHAAPGAQNHHWHSDNVTHVPLFWQHPHFQDRAVHLWEVLADRYKDRPEVAGYNLLNEPADETHERLTRFYERIVGAVRAIDPRHILFLDGNTYSTEFDVFQEVWDNTVYTCHDYASAGLSFGGEYPGYTRGEWVDRDLLEEKFLRRSEYSRKTGTPIWVGEFGPVYTGEPRLDEQRAQILDDQLEIYSRYDAGWAIWTYKDIGLQGIAYTPGDSVWMQRFGAFAAKKHRLGADRWGTTGVGEAAVTDPVRQLADREFPTFQPYPWGRQDWVNTLLLNVMMAQPLVDEYAELYRGVSDDELLELADSFSLENCAVRETLVKQLTAAAAPVS